MAIVLLAMAQQEARLALTHGLLDLGASAVSLASAAAAAMEFDSVGPSSFGVLTADG